MEFAIDDYFKFLSDLSAGGDNDKLYPDLNNGDAFYQVLRHLVPYETGKCKVYFVTYVTTAGTHEIMLDRDNKPFSIVSEVNHMYPALEDLCLLASADRVRSVFEDSTCTRYIRSSDCYPTGVTLFPDDGVWKLCVLSRVRYSHLVAHRSDFLLKEGCRWERVWNLTESSNIDTIIKSTISKY